MDRLDYLENTELEIFDAEVYSDRDGQLTSRNDGSIVHTTEKREPLKAEIEAFIDAGLEGEDPPASGRVGAQTVELLEWVLEAGVETGDFYDGFGRWSDDEDARVRGGRRQSTEKRKERTRDRADDGP